MNHQGRFNPLHLLAALIGLCVLVEVAADPSHFRLVALKSIAGSLPPTFEAHLATDVIGQLTGADGIDFNHSGVNNSPNSRGFFEPSDVALDPVNHRLFVTEAEGCNCRVLVFALDVNNQLVDHIADFVIGQPNFRQPEDVVPDARHLAGGPLGLSYDATGNRLFVTDTDFSRVLVFDTAVIVDGEAAVHVLGQPDFTSVDCNQAGTLDADTLCSPNGIFVDSVGQRLFVSDFESNHRILVFNLADGIVDGEPAVNVLGQPDFTTAVCETDIASLCFSGDMDLDVAAQRLFAADISSNRVMVWDVTTIVDGEDAIHVLGQETFDTLLCETDLDSFCSPRDVAYDPVGLRLFVADGGNNRIMVFDLTLGITDGMDASAVLGQGDFVTAIAATTQSGLSSPRGLVFDDLHARLFATDAGNFRVMVFDVATVTNGENAVDLLGQLDENDQPVYVTGGVNDSPNARGFNGGDGVALDQVNHHLFVSDKNNARVLVFNLDANNALLDHEADFVLGQPDFKSNTQGGGSNELTDPRGLVFDEASNRLFVGDVSLNPRILVFDFDLSVLANGMSADSQAFVTGGNGQVAYDGVNGRLFAPLSIFESSDQVAIFTEGKGSWVFTDSVTFGADDDSSMHVTYDQGMARLYVSIQNKCVLVFDATVSFANPPLAVLGDDTTACTTPGGTSDTRMDSVDGLFIDTAGQRLLVSDAGNNRVLVFDISDGVTNDEAAVDVYGQTSFFDGECNTAQDGLCGPVGLAFDGAQNALYIVDEINNRVMIFGPAASPTPTPPSGGGGGGGGTPSGVGFTPLRIEVNQDEGETDSKNVLVTIFAQNSSTFTGTVDVLLSNVPDFSTFVPFRYSIPGPGNQQNIWPKTVAWDLCFGLTSGSSCGLGNKTVYARFLVNIPAPTQVLGQ